MGIPWIICYMLRKDLRKEMLLMSTLLAIGGVITEYLWWTIDWWRPQTITGTVVGIEDFLLGWVNGGVAAVIYEIVTKERQKIKPKLEGKSEILSYGLLTLSILSIGTWKIGLTSFVASSIAMILSSTLLIFYRKDLLINTLISGFLMALITFPMYFIIELLSPGWIEVTWLHENLSGIFIGVVPIEDIAFYFLTGMWIGPFYELWKGEIKK